MIAASEPQEYIPGGRQQTSRHPGPIKHREDYDVFLADDNLRRNFARVAISKSDNKTESWITRKVPSSYSHKPIFSLEGSNRNDEEFDDTAFRVHLSRVSPPSRRSASSLLASGKRFSADSFQKKSDSKASLNTLNSIASVSKESFLFNDDVDVMFDKEEELYIYDGSVIWTRGSAPDSSKANCDRTTTIRCFTTDSLVKQALWCTFFRELPLFTRDSTDAMNQDENKPVGEPIDCIAVLDSACLRTYTVKGEDFISVLPIQVKKIWASKFGILFERQCKDDEPHNLTTNPKPTDLGHSHTSNTTIHTSVAVLYHLGHPLDDITPVAIANDPTGAGMIQILDDRSQQLVYASDRDLCSFCMMYDDQTQQHSVYKLRRVRRRELDELLGDNGRESSCYTTTSMSVSHFKHKNRLSSLIDGYKTTPPGLSPFSSKGTSRSSISDRREPSGVNSITNAPSRAGTPIGTTNSPWLKSSRLHTSLRAAAVGTVSNLDSVYLLESQPQEMYSAFQLTPKLCLDHLWTEPNLYSQENVRHSAATKVFLVDDMAGQWYLCYYIPSKRQLCTVKADLSNPNNMTFGATNRIQCKDAIAINALHMIAVLEFTDNIVLYSGLCLIGTLHLGGVLAQHSRLLSSNILPKRAKKIKYPAQSPYPKRSSLLPHCGTPTSELRIDLISPVLPDDINRPQNMLHIPMQSAFNHSSGGDGDASASLASQTPHHRAARFINTPKRTALMQVTPTPTTGASSTPSTVAGSRAAVVKLTELRAAINTRLTVQNSDGKYYSVRLQTTFLSRLVRNVAAALRSALPTTLALTTLSNWYATRNSLGVNIKDSADEWRLFSELLFELIGYTKDASDDSFPIVELDASKRQKLEEHGSDADYAYVLNSIQHSKAALALNKLLNFQSCKQVDEEPTKTSQSKVYSINTNSMLFPYIRIIHFTLHLLYEDLKLNTYRKADVPLLAEFLSKLSTDLNLKEYQSYYYRECADICPLITYTNPTISESVSKTIIVWPEFTLKPISILKYLSELLDCAERIEGTPAPYPFMEHVNNRSRDVILLCGSYICGMKHENQSMPLFDLINTVISNGFKSTVRSSWNNYKEDMKHSVTERIVLLMAHMGFTERSMDSYPLSIRFILFDAIWRCRENPPNDWPEQVYRLQLRSDLAAQAKIVSLHKSSLLRRPRAIDSAPDSHPHNTITEADTPFSSPTHGCYQCSTSSVALSAPNSNGGGHHLIDPASSNDDGLRDVCPTNNPVLRLRFRNDQRVMDTRRWLQSAAPVAVVVVQRPDVTDHDYIEERERHLFAITARTMALPVGRGMFSLRTFAPIITEPLTCPPLNLSGRAPPHGATIELTHIDVPTHMNLWPLFHNGVANGLRISAQVRNLDTNWIVFNRPRGSRAAEWQLEHAGLLLALGLNGHLRRLDVLSRMDYLVKVHEMTSMGMLIGLGVSFRGTCNASITKMLSVHCEALLPPTSMELDIPQHLQVAALIGIGFVYQGTSHRHMTEVLLNEIGRPPGPEMENSVDRESYGLTAGLALGLVALRQGSKPCGLADLNVPETLHYYMVGGNKRPLSGAQKDKYKVPSFQIKEGSTVNLDITAPGATLALGLMYLGTNNKAIADWMNPPSTQYLLDFVRPDFLMLRILARALIMWDDIRPNSAWVKSQVPESILPFCMVTPMDTLDIDYEAMNQAYCNIVAGACFAIGLRYAGTADSEAHNTLLEYCHMFISLTTKSLAELAGKPTIETCLNTVLLADAMVMAGTGNLEIMRIVRHLRKRINVANCAIVTYGSHLAAHMALGLIFLGGGRYTLSNSPASVAALICAFYPKFPTHSNDNRYHLQAFRHLYVLAAEPRLLIPKDISKRLLCYANINVIFLDGTSIDLCGPDMIPDLDTLVRIAVDDPRYWPVVFEKGRNWEQLRTILSTSGILSVKQRAGCLGYMEDSLGFRSDMARSLTKAVVPWQPPASAILAFTSDMLVRQYVATFLLEDESNAEEVQELEKQLGIQWTRILYECVTKDKLAILPLFSTIIKMINDLSRTPYITELKHFQLISSFVEKFSVKSTLADVEMVMSFHQEICRILEEWESDLKPLLKSYMYGELACTDTIKLQRLAAYVTFFDVPYNIGTITDPLEVLSQLETGQSALSVSKIMELLL